VYSFENKNDIAQFIKLNLVTSVQAAEILGCTRSNISDLIKRGKLKPAVELSQTMLFWREEIETRRAISPKAGRPKNSRG